MRRLAPIVLALAPVLLAVAPTAHAATLEVTPELFSPARGTLAIAGSLTLPRQVGVQLATPGGRAMGWISAPTRRQEVSVAWNGRLAGRRVADGSYLVRLVFGSGAGAGAPLRGRTPGPQR